MLNQCHGSAMVGRLPIQAFNEHCYVSGRTSSEDSHWGGGVEVYMLELLNFGLYSCIICYINV